MHILKNLGVGKVALEDMIEEQIDDLICHIDEKCLNKPIDVSNLFNTFVLASLWRIIGGETIKIGDVKVRHLLEMVQTLVIERVRPIVALSLDSIPLMNFLHNTGLTNFKRANDSILDFNLDLISSHKVSMQ